RKIAGSARWPVADLLILVALVLTIAGTLSIARWLERGTSSPIAHLGGVAALIGGAIAVASIAIEMYAFKQEARAFVGNTGPDQVGAFWATNAVDRINT